MVFSNALLGFWLDFDVNCRRFNTLNSKRR